MNGWEPVITWAATVVGMAIGIYVGMNWGKK